MKKTILILALILITIGQIGANDSEDINRLQREISRLKSNVSHLRQEDSRLRILYQTQTLELDSLKVIQIQQANNVETLTQKIGADLSEAHKKIDDNANTLSNSIKAQTWMGLIGLVIAIGLLACTYYILRKKISSGATTIDKIRSAQERLESAQKSLLEESVKLDNKLVELLDKQMKRELNDNKEPIAQKTDHSFALKVGDEIAKIETNLSKMDPEVRGYKQLKQALKRIKDNFNAQGYEIVELLGLDYNDGMPFEAQFVPDDTLPEGKRIISGISRLQINYNGEMVQTAKITVRQNI